MRPDERDFDDEIRGHLALSVRERIEGGEEPEAARLGALRELGYAPAVRDAMRRVWYGRAADALRDFGQEMRLGLRALLRARAMAATVVVTLALGLGANAAVFSVVHAVLISPLANRDAHRLVYIRQGAPGLGSDNLTFSMPEIADLTARLTTVADVGEFSTAQFTLAGLGEPRLVQAGVVNGSYFEVMGLRPVLGRLLSPADDGPHAAGAAVLTYRFWTTAIGGDPAVVGRPIQLGGRRATVVGVLEPSTPYPAETEIVANVVTSPHHLGALMVTERTHRMTELFGRLAPGASVAAAREELAAVHAAMIGAHPEVYPAAAGFAVSITPLRAQVTAPARTILLLLLAAAALVFVIACSNVANLMLARAVRREGELALRAALGASRSALRRMLLAESVVLCGAGAALGILLAYPLMRLVARVASRFSARALEVSLDPVLLWTGGGLAMLAAVLLAFVPRLPAGHGRGGGAPAARGVRLPPGGARRLHAFATLQIACSFVLLALAGTLLTTLLVLQTARPGFGTKQVLAVDVPPAATGVAGAPVVDLLDEATRRISGLPEVRGVAAGSFVPWRDAGSMPEFPFAVDGYAPEDGEGPPHARFRIVSPGFFGVLGVRLVAGRDFTGDDRAGGEPVVIVSQSVARRFFADGDAVGHTLRWTAPVLGKPRPRRIVGIVADFDDEHVVAGPALTIFQPMRQVGFGHRLFVRTAGDPYAIAPEVARTVREISETQLVERAATLADVRAEALAPERLSALAVGAFAGVALLVAVVGVTGVLAFSVSARTREFGVRLAIGSTRRHLLARVMSEGARMVLVGIAGGAAGGLAGAGLIASYVEGLRLPGVLPAAAAATVIVVAGLVAALMPAARASRVDVVQALRSE